MRRPRRDVEAEAYASQGGGVDKQSSSGLGYATQIIACTSYNMVYPILLLLLKVRSNTFSFFYLKNKLY